MGRMIEQVALQRGHSVVCVIDREETHKYATAEFQSADVAIEFSMPDAAVENILKSFAAGVPVVCGTTGWYKELPELEALTHKGKGTLLHATNFSIGVNIFRAMSRRLAEIMAGEPQYHAVISEVHHVHKLDHPSGTAISLAEDIVEVSPRLERWAEPEDDALLPPEVLPVLHQRCGEVPGIHSVCWESEQDNITISHSARGREGFALGAVLAAEWLCGKPCGTYTMADVLHLDF